MYASTDVITTADQCQAIRVGVSAVVTTPSGDTASAAATVEDQGVDVSGSGTADLVRTPHSVSFVNGPSVDDTMASKEGPIFVGGVAPARTVKEGCPSSVEPVMAQPRRSLGRWMAGAAAALAALVMLPAPVSGQEAATSVEQLLLTDLGPAFERVPDGPGPDDPGPLDLSQAARMFDPTDPGRGQAVLQRLGFHAGHSRLWLDAAGQRAAGVLVLSFSDRVDDPADEATLQDPGEELVEAFATPGIPGGAGWEFADEASVQYSLGNHFAGVFVFPGGPGGRALALDLAARQRGRLPAPQAAAPVGAGDSAADAIGEVIGRALVIGVPLMILIGAVVAGALAWRRRGSPPPAVAPPEPSAPPPAAAWPAQVPAAHVPAKPLRSPSPPRRRKPTGTGARRRGSPVI